VIRSGSWHVGKYRLQTSEPTARVLTQRFERDKDERDFSYATCSARVTENVLQVEGPPTAEAEAFRSRRNAVSSICSSSVRRHNASACNTAERGLHKTGRVLDVAEQQ
jgi:hypothetical protein